MGPLRWGSKFQSQPETPQINHSRFKKRGSRSHGDMGDLSFAGRVLSYIYSKFDSLTGAGGSSKCQKNTRGFSPSLILELGIYFSSKKHAFSRWEFKRLCTRWAFFAQPESWKLFLLWSWNLKAGRHSRENGLICTCRFSWKFLGSAEKKGARRNRADSSLSVPFLFPDMPLITW